MNLYERANNREKLRQLLVIQVVSYKIVPFFMVVLQYCLVLSTYVTYTNCILISNFVFQF